MVTLVWRWGTEAKIQAQAREIQQLRAQLARVAVHNTAPSLPPLSLLEIEKALQKERMAQWMQMTLANLRAFVALRASNMVGLGGSIRTGV